MSRRVLWVASLCLAVLIVAIAPGAKSQERDDPQFAEAELQAGIALTGKGQFAQAIPHLKAASGKVRQEYAASFNLALCYVGTSQFREAVAVLDSLRSAGSNSAGVNNLLSQSYLALGEAGQARAAFERAAALSPDDERLFVLIADACSLRQAYNFGMEVVDRGLKRFPQSARLHFERASLLSNLDQMDQAAPEFREVARLAPDSDLAYLALAQASLQSGDIKDAISHAREGVQRGHDDYMLLAILGEALIRSGVVPGESGFAEAKAVLERSVSSRPNYPSAQIAFGRLLLMENNIDGAIVHLEVGRSLQPDVPAAYASLITAYRRKGQNRAADETMRKLAELNQASAQQIGTASGDRRAGYGVPQTKQADQH